MLSGKRAIAGLVATGNLIVFYVAGAFLAPTENPRSAKGWNQCTIALFSFLSCTFALPLSLKTGSAPTSFDSNRVNEPISYHHSIDNC